MFKQILITFAISGLLGSGPAVLAEEAHPSDQADGAKAPAAVQTAPTGTASTDTAMPMGKGSPMRGEMKMGGGVPSGQMPGRGMMGPAGGMMQKMMRPGGAAGETTAQMPMAGRMGMGRPCAQKEGGGMMGKGMMNKGMMGKRMMMAKHRQLVNRLDLIDARLAKIEAMLERLLQR